MVRTQPSKVETAEVLKNKGRSSGLRSIELFAGGGGLAEGLHEASFQHILVNEFNARACETLRLNRPEGTPEGWPLVPGDVRGVDFTPFEGRIDLLAGGPPCQPFSLGGLARGDQDERNGFPWFFRAMRETRPKAILCENVAGLLRPSFAPYFEYIIRELSAPFEQRIDGESWTDHDRRLEKTLRSPARDASEHYDVHVIPVNAADYGVPQVRRRVLIIAFRRDLSIDWLAPTPTHSEAALAFDLTDGTYWERHRLSPRAEAMDKRRGPTDELRPWLTLRDAIADLPEPLMEYKLEHPDVLHHVRWPGARIYPGHTPNVLDRPAKTVKAGVHGVPGGESVMRLDDGSIRYMTVRETARVMTFPDSWRIAGPRGEQMRQLGNAVPVRLAHVFAESVAAVLRS